MSSAEAAGVVFDAVSFGYEQPLLDGLSLSLAAHSITAVVGASGCGKSTLLRLAAGLLTPDAGSISRPDGARAMAFQSPNLLPWRSVLANVRLPLELSGVAADSADAQSRALLEAVELADVAGKLPHQLSGGMQMRVALARALVTEPALLLLDEPFSALDPLTRKRVRGVFLRLWHEVRPTVVLVTHDIDEAVLLADRVICLGGSPATVLADLAVDLERPRDSHDPAVVALADRLELML